MDTSEDRPRTDSSSCSASGFFGSPICGKSESPLVGTCACVRSYLKRHSNGSDPEVLLAHEPTAQTAATDSLPPSATPRAPLVSSDTFSRMSFASLSIVLSGSDQYIMLETQKFKLPALFTLARTKSDEPCFALFHF